MIFSPQKIIRLQSVDSTNSYLSNQINNKAITLEGTAVTAVEQLKGRGSHKNIWESEKGKNLTCSFLLNPVFLKAEQQFLLNMTISLALYDLVRSFITAEKVSIKWPNDIYIRDKKVAGILIDNIIEGNKFIHSIIGIGLNINQEKFSNLIPNPISFAQVLKKATDIEKVFFDLLKTTENRYHQLLNRELTRINNDYLKALYRMSERHFYYYKGERIYAEIKGVSTYGHLQLITSNSVFIECDFKEIIFII